MITKNEAEAIVQEYLKTQETPSIPFAIKKDATIEKSYGWIFFYNTREYLETGNVLFLLAGNGPIIVNRQNGAMTFGGTVQSISAFIEEYEKNLNNGVVEAPPPQ